MLNLINLMTEIELVFLNYQCKFKFFSRLRQLQLKIE